MAAPATGHVPRISARRAYLQLLVTVSVWGGTFTVARRAVEHADPLAVATGRYVVGAIVLWAILAARRRFTVPGRRDLLVCAIMGASGIVGFNILTFFGLEHALAGDAALIMPTMPSAVTIPAAVLLFHERFGRWQALGLGLLAAGEVLVFREAVFSSAVDSQRLAGIGLFFCAAALWGIYTIAVRFLSGRVDAAAATAWAVAIALVVLLPAGGLPLAREFSGGPGGAFLLALLYMGALQVVVGLVWWFQGVEGVGAARAAVVNSLVPVIALAIAAIVLGEGVSAERAAGAALVVTGVAVAAGFGREPAPVVVQPLPPGAGPWEHTG